MARTALITGCNAGIGFATAQALVAAGYSLILWARTLEKAEQAREKLLNDAPNARIDVVAAELGDLVAVAKTAAEIAESYPQLDVLVNNAGFYPSAVKFNAQGVEETLWASHLGHFVLTRALLPLLERGDDARIVNVSSTAHVFGSADRFFTQKPRNTFNAYADAKLANVIFTLGLRKFFPKLRAYALHPGVIDTNLPTKSVGWFRFLFKLARPFLSTPEKGAATSVYLSTTPNAQINAEAFYFEKSRASKSKHADLRAEVVDWFWAKSEELASK